MIMVLLFALFIGTGESSLQLRLKAEASFRQRTAKSVLEAADAYEELLKDEDLSAKKKIEYHQRCAEAVNAYMRMKTHGNTITIHGSVDTSENKQIWAKHGPRALNHARYALRNSKKCDARTAAIYADAFMFEGSARGLVQQALTGAGSKFLENAKRLQKLDHAYDAALGYTLEGCFYHVAPFPVKNKKKAKSILHKATTIAPSSKRNHYHYAVVCYCQGDYSTAYDEFSKALHCRPSGNDIDFAPFIDSQAKLAKQSALNHLP
eukprot:CAMPEP_0197299550 /NCGR_PEP_ID=MMETSP0890-20130614/46268_1 /TAXON_ID=44058 ORGANISM="Aureoumbra lagunensis, Strain CCMP1510" /NCGR_SAMPLE_ID=MMETSP0890 /ASSEMBLY_ACC=CAM_ASM_000533 /LENGTH=263 /DNA_ID=CAMNT_0042777909 /DNA_START=58 /DNA_END=849 /DNA_ORIENTATION=-